MTEPTDAELEKLFVEETGFDIDDFPAAILDFARAVLARWGTPPAVAGEPIGYLYCGGSYGDELADWEIVADQHQCDKLNEHHGSLGKEAKLPLYTTPPAQPQAWAVPMSHEAAKALVRKYGKDPLHLVLQVERHHGITGGQHGTD